MRRECNSEVSESGPRDLGLSEEKLTAKKNAELDFWIEWSQNLTKDCHTAEKKEAVLLQVCRKYAFPRYKESLYVEDGSFEGKRILDLCCGPHCGIIGFTGAEKFGADDLIVDFKRIGYPLDRHSVAYSQCKSENLPFEANFFDAVLCVNALDHVDDLGETIREISRVLTPGGSFLGQVNFHLQPTSTEPHCLTHHELLEYFHASNMEVVEIKFQHSVEEVSEQRYYYELKKASS